MEKVDWLYTQRGGYCYSAWVAGVIVKRTQREYGSLRTTWEPSS
jgi:hypothetical protein